MFGNPVEKPNRLPRCRLGLNAPINWLWSTPACFIASEDQNFLEARDLDGEIEKAFADEPNSGLLLRPDRYVAAVLPLDQISDLDSFNRQFDEKFYAQSEAVTVNSI